MPFKKIIFLASSIYLLTSFAPLARAATDPISATASATATVPSSGGVTSDEDSPTPPILIRPYDGTQSNNNQIEFVWQKSSDPNGNTVVYTLYLNGVATYLGISNIGNSAGPGYTAHLDDGDEIRLLPTTAIPDGVYDWYVSATDPSGNTSYSTTWNLTIDTVAPSLTIVDMEKFHLPTITDGAIFDIRGPKAINFTIQSDPYATVELTISPGNIQLSSLCDLSGNCYFSPHLAVDEYRVSVVAIDLALNTTALPAFILNITQAEIVITIPTIPGVTEPTGPIVIPYTPYSLPSLPATISKISSRESISTLVYILLAVGIGMLLILLLKKKYNLVLLNDQGLPYTNTKVYHSIPTTKLRISNIFATRLPPISYLLVSSDHGRLYIPYLTRYSTLTIRTDKTTYILSLCAKRKIYTIYLS